MLNACFMFVFVCSTFVSDAYFLRTAGLKEAPLPKNNKSTTRPAGQNTGFAAVYGAEFGMLRMLVLLLRGCRMTGLGRAIYLGPADPHNEQTHQRRYVFKRVIKG